jgi:hypothetical protein
MHGGRPLRACNVTAGRRRRTYTAEQIAQALAIAAERGIGAAEIETGIPAGTLRSRIARARNAPDALEELAAEPAGAYSLLAELEQEQREALEDLRRARREGKPPVGPATAHGIAVDKLLKVRDAERARPPLGEGDDSRARIAALRDAVLAAQLRRYGTATPDELRVVAAGLHGEIRQLQERRRTILAEMGIRRAGGKSLFGWISEMDQATWPAAWRTIPVDELVVTGDWRDDPKPAPPARPEPPARVVVPDPVEVPEPLEREPEVEPDGDAAEVVPITRPRRAWPGRSVQERFLEAEGIDPTLFKPPGA